MTRKKRKKNVITYDLMAAYHPTLLDPPVRVVHGSVGKSRWKWAAHIRSYCRCVFIHCCLGFGQAGGTCIAIGKRVEDDAYWPAVPRWKGATFICGLLSSIAVSAVVGHLEPQARRLCYLGSDHNWAIHLQRT
jgi:hypothetical protein